MGFFKRLFGRSWEADIEEAIFQDACEAFARFSAAHGQDHITGFAACTVDDASPPYYMGATLESGFGPVGSLTDPGPESYGWNADPADWCWSDGTHPYRMDEVKYPPFGEGIKGNKKVIDAMCRGLKKFADSGKFKGKLLREQMVLMLWINDPSYPSWAVEYAAKLNPKPVAEWFKVANTYAGNEDVEEG
jgi:hypothetical protein